MVVSSRTLENAALKAVKHLTLIKKAKVKVDITGRDVEIKLRLILWAGAQVPSLLSELQQEVQTRVKRLLGAENQLKVTCDVRGIEEAGAASLDVMTTNK